MALFNFIKPGNRSLKTTLGLYFIPITILPTIFISIYATNVFVNNTRESFVRRATANREAILSDIQTQERELIALARSRSRSPRVINTAASRSRAGIENVLNTFQKDTSLRVYGTGGEFLGGRAGTDMPKKEKSLSSAALQRVKVREETVDRYFTGNGGFITVIRRLIKGQNRLYGVFEQEYRFGRKDLFRLKEKHNLDIVFLNRKLSAEAATFAMSPELVKSFSSLAFSHGRAGEKEAVDVELGKERFAAFLFDLPGPQGRPKKWGHFAIFLSLTSADSIVGQLKTAMIYVTLLLVLIAALLILIFSNRLVRPIAELILGMKRLKTGRAEQIPHIESTYEIEYLVQAFNEMARNVGAAKRALELKLAELHHANMELRNTQTTLVQSAKMVSLGQLVAGVAHELNNPIGFIYSNMHHLDDYTKKISELVAMYRKYQNHLPEEERKKLEDLEESIELDFVLQDMEDLTRSCVEGAARTRDIVLGLRTFSRMDESIVDHADIHEGRRGTVKLLVTDFKERVTIHEDYGDSIPLVECNISQLNQVFMNLISNAAQAIEGRGSIWIRTFRRDNRVVIEIEDNGKGIPPEVQEKIFDPFFTTKGVGKGTGLGLSIAYGLVEKHHGTITVRSEVGVGTCFTIQLPVHQPDTREAG